MLESLEVLDPVKPYDNPVEIGTDNPGANTSMLSSMFKDENF
jgi:hypothetical protein